MARTGRPTGRPATASLKIFETKLEVTIPEPPADLGNYGRKFWAETFEFATWLNPELDSYLVAQAARLADDMAEARAEIARTGRYIQNPNGSMQRSPAVVDLEKLTATQNTYLTSLALTPSDRARLGVATIQAFDELDVLNRLRDSRNQITEPLKLSVRPINQKGNKND